jgi:hypothetical protein
VFLSPTVKRPTTRVPAMAHLITGMWSASSASKAALKFSDDPCRRGRREGEVRGGEVSVMVAA